MLDQLKGARVELKFGTETVAGAIVGGRTRPRQRQTAGARAAHPACSIRGELRTLDLSAANGIRFTDPQLQQQFKDYLGALAASRSKDKRSVYIDSTDAKARDVVRQLHDSRRPSGNRVTA